MGNACGKPREHIHQSGVISLDISLIETGALKNSQGQVLTTDQISEIIDDCKCKLKQNENNSVAHLELGICLFAIGYYEASETHLTRSRQHSKFYQSAYLLGMISLSKSNFKDSQNYFKSCINESTNPSGYIKLGEVLLRRSKFSLARRFIKQGLELNPNNSELMTVLGMTYLPSDLEKSSKYTKKAIKINPELFKPYINLAEIRKAQEKYEKSIKYYQLAIEKGNNVQKGFAQLLLASLYFEIGKLSEAIEYCKDSISFNPSLISIMKSKGFDCIFNDKNIQICVDEIIQQKFESAIQKLKNLYQNNKNSIPICYFLAVAYFESHHFHKSKRFYRKVMHLSINGENNQLSKILVARAESVLQEIEINEKNLENIEEIQKDMSENEEENEKLVEEKIGKAEEIITLEGNYPNFFEEKVDEVNENVMPVENNSREPPKFFVPKKHNSLRQFAASADPEPGNCSIF